MKHFSAVILTLLLGLLGWLFLRPPPDRTRSAPVRSEAEAACPRSTASRLQPDLQPAPERVRWLFLGAADAPAQSQVSLEQDGLLLRRVLGPAGVFLFAGGPGASNVQVQQPATEQGSDRLMAALADLIAPRGGRDSRYRQSVLPVRGAASLDEVKSTLRRLLVAGSAPLLIYIGGHGEQGETDRQNFIGLWGGPRLTARELAVLLDGPAGPAGPVARPVRLVVTSCYGGGFAEAVFRGAEAKQGVARGRCGFFATTADLPATGCDPNPDRQAQEGYALHFFNALAGRDRSGKIRPPGESDLDGDGRVSLAEAHVQARVGLDSVDVPTTTSERWLREVGPRRGPRRALPLPEERAVVLTLARRVRIPADLAAAGRALGKHESEIEEVRTRLDGAYAAEDAAARRSISELLSRWPLLDDPWHPGFAEQLRCQQREIAEHLRSSLAYAEYLTARGDVADAEDEYWELRREAAPVERLVRALENIELAERLYARAGTAWARYAELLACERWVPVPPPAPPR